MLLYQGKEIPFSEHVEPAVGQRGMIAELIKINKN